MALLSSFQIHFLINFIGVQLLCIVVLVSAVEQMNQPTCAQTPPFGLLSVHHSGLSSLCFAACSHQLSVYPQSQQCVCLNPKLLVIVFLSLSVEVQHVYYKVHKSKICSQMNFKNAYICETTIQVKRQNISECSISLCS